MYHHFCHVVNSLEFFPVYWDENTVLLADMTEQNVPITRTDIHSMASATRVKTIRLQRQPRPAGIALIFSSVNGN